MVSIFMNEVSDARLVIHTHSLFGPMIAFKKDAPFPSCSSASLLNNPMYNLKLAHSVNPLSNRQFIMKRNMGTNLSDLIDLSMKVNIVMVCRRCEPPQIYTDRMREVHQLPKGCCGKG